MRVVLITLFVLIYRVAGHGQHGGGGNQPPPAGHVPHVQRKMEDYVHDME